MKDKEKLLDILDMLKSRSEKYKEYYDEIYKKYNYDKDDSDVVEALAGYNVSNALYENALFIFSDRN